MKVTLDKRNYNIIGIFFHNTFEGFRPAPRCQEYPWQKTKRELQAEIFLTVLEHFDGWTENAYEWLGAPIEKWNGRTAIYMMMINPELLLLELNGLLNE